MRKIVTHIWFDTQAKEAAEFYTKTFKNSKIEFTDRLHDTPSGDTDIVSLTIEDHDFMFISAGPLFKPNPSVSFMVACESSEEVQELWDKLAPGGKPLMDIGEYPFAKKYGWLEDKFGVSWQISYMEGQPVKQKITPELMFTQAVAGKAKEAMEFYTSIFPASGIDMVSNYGESAMGNDKPEHINYASFHLVNQGFAAMDSSMDHKFTFSEAISLMVHCKDQAEIDMYWEKLSAVPESEQCGWLKDKFGVSWQIVPIEMDQMMQSTDQAAKQRVTKAFLQMKKFDVAELKRAFEGK